MKFIIPKSVAEISPRHYWLGGIGIIAFITIVSIILSFVGSGRIEDALLSGQRIEISLESGEVHGKVQTIKPPEEEKKVAEKAEDIKEEVKDAEAPPEDAEKLPEEQISDRVKKELAWIDEDFIGPRISEVMVEVLVGGEKKELEVKRISVSDLGDKPIIVIILKGLGLSASTTEHALELSENVTLGFSPYAPALEDWALKAKEKGHEIILNIPMETKDYNINDPGPYALLTSASKDDNNTRLKQILSLMKGYEAVYSEKEEKFTKSVKSVKEFLSSLKGQGKYFVYGGGYAEFSLIQVADSLQYPILVNDILLDDVISEKGINKKLREIESRARERGYVVVMANPYPITIRMLERWLPQVEARGLQIAPISLLLGKSFVD